MISTRDLSEMPDIEATHRMMRTLAMLDAVLCPEWEFRYFSFNDDWEPGEKLGLMRNGEGDDWLLFFNLEGAIVKGYQHDAPMAEESPWPGLFDDVPETFEKFLDDPAFLKAQTTFCVWALREDGGDAAGEDAEVNAGENAEENDGPWRRSDFDLPAGDDPDGSAELMRFFDGDPATYKAWGDEYFGVPLDLEVLRRFYEHEPLVPALVRALNPDADLDRVRIEAQEIGYPVGN